MLSRQLHISNDWRNHKISGGVYYAHAMQNRPQHLMACVDNTFRSTLHKSIPNPTIIDNIIEKLRKTINTICQGDFLFGARQP